MMKELSKMQEEDAHDDNRDLIAMETSNQIHTRAQMRGAENDTNSHVLETNDVGNDTNSQTRHYMCASVLPHLCLI